MDIPLTITFRNMTPSASVENEIGEKAEKLGSFCDRIMSCRVIVEAPHRHHHKGKAFQVRIDLSVPGKEIVINHAPKQLAAVKLTEGQRLRERSGRKSRSQQAGRSRRRVRRDS